MRILATGKQRQQGFTLLELLVVLTVIGLLMSVVSLTLFPGQSMATLESNHNRLSRHFNALLEYSILNGAPVAVSIREDSTVVAYVHQENRWQSFTTRNIELFSIADDVGFRWQQKIEMKKALTGIKPDIIFSPEGLVSPFHLVLSKEGETDRVLSDRSMMSGDSG